MNDAFLMRMLHGITDLEEELQPFFDGQLVSVTMLSDGHAGHEFHDKIGPASFCRSGVIDARDVRMIEKRQRLPLGLEAGNHLLGVHPRLDDLQCDLALQGDLLLGTVHHPHAAFTQDTEKLVVANPPAGLRRPRLQRDR